MEKLLFGAPNRKTSQWPPQSHMPMCWRGVLGTGYLYSFWQDQSVSLESLHGPLAQPTPILPSSPHTGKNKQWSIASLLCLCQGLSKPCYTLTHTAQLKTGSTVTSKRLNRATDHWIPELAIGKLMPSKPLSSNNEVLHSHQANSLKCQQGTGGANARSARVICILSFWLKLWPEPTMLPLTPVHTPRHEPRQS